MNSITRNQKEESKGLKIHGIVTLGVSVLLAFINVHVSPWFLWFQFPLAGMSVGLIIHYLGVRRSMHGEAKSI